MYFQTLKSFRSLLSTAAVACALAVPAVAFADGMPNERPRARAPRKVEAPAPVVVAPVAAPVVRAAPQAVPVEQECGCTDHYRLSGGLPVAFFAKESNLPLAGAALDFWCDELPINFRIGVEGRHMYLGQDNAEFAREAPDKTTRVTYIRIPFAAEYMAPLDEATTLYVGGGPDIVVTANDISETGAGMHLSSRVHYAFTDELGVSLEAGYMWAGVDGQGGQNIRLDSAFVSPMLTYTF